MGRLVRLPVNGWDKIYEKIPCDHSNRVPVLSPLTVTIYRNLRDLAKRIDQNAAFRGILKIEKFDFVSNAVQAYCGGEGGYLPQRPFFVQDINSVQDAIIAKAAITGNESAKAFLTSIFRNALIAGSQNLEISSSMTNAAFEALRELRRLESISQKIHLEKPWEGQLWKSARTCWGEEISRRWKGREPLPKLKIGSILAASPLVDEIWGRAVIILTKHDPIRGGSEGVILNRKCHENDEIEKKIKFLARQTASNYSNKKQRISGDPGLKGVLTTNKDFARLLNTDQKIVRFGGPVVGGVVLHDTKEKGGTRISENLYAGCKDQIDGKHLKFLGCSAWAPGQLAAEINEGAWIPINFENENELEDIVFNEKVTGDDLWKKLLSSLSTDFAELSRIPKDANQIFTFDNQASTDIEDEWSDSDIETLTDRPEPF